MFPDGKFKSMRILIIIFIFIFGTLPSLKAQPAKKKLVPATYHKKKKVLVPVPADSHRVPQNKIQTKRPDIDTPVPNWVPRGKDGSPDKRLKHHYPHSKK